MLCSISVISGMYILTGYETLASHAEVTRYLNFVGLTSYIYDVTRYIIMKPLKSYLKITLELLFVLCNPDLIIIKTELLKPFLPFFFPRLRKNQCLYFLFL